MLLLLQSAASGAQGLSPSLFTNTNTFYSPTVTPGAVTLTPDLFTNTNTFYSATVSQTGATQDLTPDLFTNTNTFYSPTASATYALTAGLFTNTNTFYAPTVTPGAVTLTPDLFTNDNTFYSPTVDLATFAQDLTPPLFANDNTFYQHVLTGGAIVTAQAGAPGRRVRFRGRYYDSVKDRRKLARDMTEFLAAEAEETPQPKKAKKVANIPAPKVVLAADVIAEMDAVFTALNAEIAQREQYIAELRTLNDQMDEDEFLMMAAA